MLFSSFESYDNTQAVTENLMWDIATFAHTNLDMSKPIHLHGLRFLRVTQKTEGDAENRMDEQNCY